MAGLAWSALCVWLAIDGHAPSVTLVPIPRDAYYAAQAAFVIPVLLGQWLVLSAVARRIARSAESFRDTARRLAPAFAYPVLVFLVVPDAVVYLLWGFDALSQAVRVTAPLLALGTWAAVTAALHRGGGIPLGRSILAALVGLLAQAALGAPFLR